MFFSLRPSFRQLILGAGPWFLFLLLSTARAEPVTLVQLQEYAVAHRSLIQEYQVEAARAEQTVQISRSPWYPRLDTRYSVQQLDQATPTEPRAGSRFEAGLSYNLYAGGRDRHTLQAAELTAEAAGFQLASGRADLRLQVALRYLDCYESYHRLRITTEEMRLLKQRYEDTHNRFQVGLLRRNDVLKIQVELDYVRQARRSAETDYANRIGWLAREVDRPLSASELTFSDLASLPQLDDQVTFEISMLNNRSDLQALERHREALRQQVQVVAAGAYPLVDVALVHAHYGDNFALGAGSLHNDDTRLQLNLSLNLFDGYRTRHTRTRALLAVEAATHALTEHRLHLSTTLEQILRDYQVALDNLTVARGAIEQARENLRVTDAAFREGLETATDVLDAVFQLSRAEFSLTSARVNLFREYYRLLRMLEQG